MLFKIAFYIIIIYWLRQELTEMLERFMTLSSNSPRPSSLNSLVPWFLLGTHDLQTQVIFSRFLRNRKEKCRERDNICSLSFLFFPGFPGSFSKAFGSSYVPSSVLRNGVTVGNNNIMHGEAKLLSGDVSHLWNFQISLGLPGAKIESSELTNW